MSAAMWQVNFSIMYSKLDLPFLARSAVPWTYTESRLDACTVWCVAFAWWMVTLLITQAAEEAQCLSGAVGRGCADDGYHFEQSKWCLTSDCIEQMSHWSLLWVQQFSLWYCTGTMPTISYSIEFWTSKAAALKFEVGNNRGAHVRGLSHWGSIHFCCCLGQ